MPTWTQWIGSWFTPKQNQKQISSLSQKIVASPTISQNFQTNSPINNSRATQPQQQKLMSAQTTPITNPTSIIQSSQTQEIISASTDTTLTMEKKIELEALFATIHRQELEEANGEDESDDSELLTLAGVVQLAKLLQMDISNDLCLLIGFYKMGLPTTGAWKLTLEQFCKLANFGVGNADEIRVLFRKWQQELKQNPKEFTKFYDWLFGYLNDGKTNMLPEEAMLIWQLLEFCTQWKMFDSFKEFVKTKKAPITRDTWKLLLSYSKQFPTRKEILKFDSNDSCWPSLLDEFSTEWVPAH